MQYIKSIIFLTILLLVVHTNQTVFAGESKKSANMSVTSSTAYPVVVKENAYAAVTVGSKKFQNGYLRLYVSQKSADKNFVHFSTKKIIISEPSENHIFLLNLLPGSYQVHATFKGVVDNSNEIKSMTGPRSDIKLKKGYINYIGGYELNGTKDNNKSCIRVNDDRKNIFEKLTALAIENNWESIPFRTKLMKPIIRKHGPRKCR